MCENLVKVKVYSWFPAANNNTNSISTVALKRGPPFQALRRSVADKFAASLMP
eukprot:COSAG02_NODE_9528_length_2189_cov_1.312440_3_plen_52_part_01